MNKNLNSGEVVFVHVHVNVKINIHTVCFRSFVKGHTLSIITILQDFIS